MINPMISVAISTPFAKSSFFLFKNRKNKPKLSKAPKLTILSTNLNCMAFLKVSSMPYLEKNAMYSNTPIPVEITPKIKPRIMCFLLFKLPRI